MATFSISAFAQQNLPEGAIARLGKGAMYSNIVYSPDGGLLAMAVLADIWLYDTRNGQEVARLAGHTGAVRRVSFSPDGQTVASEGWDNTVRLWDVATRTLRHTLREAKSRISFSPDSKTLAASFGNGVRLWDVATGEPLQKTFQGGFGSFNSVSFSGDGQTLAVAHRDGVCLYDVATGRPRHIVNPSAPIDNWSGGISFSPDGQTFITFYFQGYFGTPGSALEVWDISTGTLRNTLEVEGGVASISLSPDGKLLATASGRTVRLWDISTGTLRNTLEGHTDSVRSVSFSGDGQILASGSWDQTVRLWDVATGTLRNTLEGHTNLVWNVFCSPDGQTLVSVSHGWGDQTVRLWDVPTGTLRHTFEGSTYNVRSVFFSPDGQTLVTASGGAVRLWDVATHTLRDVFQHGGWLSVSLSPDGKIVASGSQSYRQVHLWDVATGTRLRTLDAFYGDIHSVSLSPDGQTVASGSEFGTVILWDVATGTLRKTFEGHLAVARDRFRDSFEGHAGNVNSISFSPDGKILASGSDDETVRLWDVSDGTRLRTLPIGAKVNSVSFSPDGQMLANGHDSGTWKENIHLWDIATGTLLQALEVPRSSYSFVDVLSVSFSPDGQTVASGSSDNTVRLWDVATGTLRHTFEGHLAEVNSVSFSPDGQTVASASYDGTILLWDLTLKPPRLAADINGDDEVNIQDLVAVAAALGQAGENDADVNGDGEVNIQDLVAVAAALGEVAAAPAALRQQGAAHLTQEEVQHWLTQAQQANLTDATSVRGIRFLAQLLSAMTPKETTLLPNYPNPFNPETWIPYQLAQPADVALTIYDIQGRVVRDLDLGHQRAGIYHSQSRAAYWDGRNAQGESVASGVYFYTLSTESTRDSVTAGEFTATRKMLIRK